MVIHKMNKKGELVTLAFLLFMGILIFGSLIYADLTSKEPIFIGDKSTNISYNVRSSNTNCNLEDISIDKDNLVYFGNHSEQNFIIDKKCN